MTCQTQSALDSFTSSFFWLQSAQLFLDSYDSFRELFNALSTLDVLAGFAAATSPDAAPAGCAFCRPTFAASAAGAGDGSSGGAPPPLRLQGLWHPSLLASRAVDVGSGGIQASSLVGCDWDLSASVRIVDLACCSSKVSLSHEGRRTAAGCFFSTGQRLEPGRTWRPGCWDAAADGPQHRWGGAAGQLLAVFADDGWCQPGYLGQGIPLKQSGLTSPHCIAAT